MAGRACKPSLFVMVTVAVAVFDTCPLGSVSAHLAVERSGTDGLPRSGLRVRLFQQREDILDRGRLPEEASERLLAQVSEDRLHGVEVILRSLLRAQQQEDGVHRLAIEETYRF